MNEVTAKNTRGVENLFSGCFFFVSLTSQMAPMGSNLIVMSLPNRDELSLRTVLAFPKASRMGLA